MADSDVLRVQRMRAHRKDDHSLCLPKNCEFSGMVGRSRGARLEADLLGQREMSPAEKELIRAISRTADEIDDLEDYLAGRRGRWLSVVLEGLQDVPQVIVNVDNVLSALDRKRSTLTRLMSELRQYGRAATSAAAGSAGPAGARRDAAGPPQEGVTSLAGIRARRRPS